MASVPRNELGLPLSADPFDEAVLPGSSALHLCTIPGLTERLQPAVQIAHSLRGGGSETLDADCSTIVARAARRPRCLLADTARSEHRDKAESGQVRAGCRGSR